MDEFKHLPWPVLDIGTNVRETYTLNMPDYRANNPTDVFFCNLLEIDSYHLQNMHAKMNNSDEIESGSDELVPRKFLDPRTGIEIPSHECNHKNVDFEKRNTFLNNFIQASSLPKSQHIAGLNAMRGIKSSTEQTTQEHNYRMLDESSAANRFQEKQLFLDKLREHYFAKLSQRFHNVPPSINYFITQKWKKQLIEMHRRLANARYCMRTGISLQPSQCAVKIDYLHHEHLGNVPKMTEKHIEYLKQSYPNLMEAYKRQKTTQIFSAVNAKVNELIREHGIDFVIPISTLKLILNLNTKRDWLFCMTVRESSRSTSFQSEKEIILEKPLPPMRISGNERYHKGAKYLFYSCLNQIDTENNDNPEIETLEVQSKASDSHVESIEYKIFNNDEFIRQYPKNERCYENRTFTIIEMKACDDIENDGGTFKVLIPSKYATCKKNDENGEIQFMNYSPKIEFQAEYGAEVMTKEELLDEWCNLFFRPNTCTERVRFDSVSGKVIHRQSISLMQVQSELEDRFGIETEHLLQRLWNVLQTINAFPTGEYLLQRDKKQSDRVKVYERVKNNGSSIGITISQIFEDVSFDVGVFDKAEWLPIDENVITELHDKLQILPCAFPHAEYLRENYVKVPIEQQNKSPKTNKTPPKFRKIRPANDAYEIKKKIEFVKLKKEEQAKQGKKISQVKYLKKAKRRAEKAKVQKERKLETMEFESTKKLLIDTMDQYDTISGQSLSQAPVKCTIAPDDDGSIAARTRNRTKNNSPEKTTRSKWKTKR